MSRCSVVLPQPRLGHGCGGGGRFRCRLSSGAAVAVSACPCRSCGCPHRRAVAGDRCPARGVRCPRVRAGGVRRPRRLSWLTSAAEQAWRRGRTPSWDGDCGSPQSWPAAVHPGNRGPRAVSGRREIGRCDSVLCRCCSRDVRTVGVRRGHCRSLRVSTATETGRLAGGRWTGAATAGTRGPVGAGGGRRAGAHVGHGRALQRRGLLGAQSAKPQAQQVAAPPAGHDHTGDHLRVDAQRRPGATRPGAQLHPSDRAQTPALPAPGQDGRSQARTAGCRPAGARPDAAARPAPPPAPRAPRPCRSGRGAGRGSSPAPGRAPSSRRRRFGRAAPLARSRCWLLRETPRYSARPPPSPPAPTVALR
jgi:hypothetical protein